MINHLNKILKGMVLALFIFCLPAAANDTDFDAKIATGLIIGRPISEGVKMDEVTHPLLTRISRWVHLDPLSKKMANSVPLHWPNDDFAQKARGTFDVVMFEFGVATHIGEPGLGKRNLANERYKELQARGQHYSELGEKEPDCFYAPGARIDYNSLLWKLHRDEHNAICAKYEPLIDAEKAERKSILEVGIRSSFSCLKTGGSLFVPLRDVLDVAELARILGLSPALVIAESWSSPDGGIPDKNPLLPRVDTSLDCGYDWTWAVIRNQGAASAVAE